MTGTTSPVLLINPNSSCATTDMMLAIARRAAGGRTAVVSATATRGPAMIVTPGELDAAADEVVEIGLRHAAGCAGIIVGAFGDPGAETLQARAPVPVVGLCEASMLAAARGGRRFGVATVTPELADAIAGHARRLGLAGLYTGIRCSVGDPRSLAQDPARLHAALAEQVTACIDADGAEAVIIGGGPLGQAAETLQPLFTTPVLAPIPCAMERLLGLIAARA
ncbi:aspartate/glutamate racemase family protein [Azorhizobium doebereinerae]|uniref:aspartate/glutamate racemase family protein n=1 Tax=Azorhizobium doebereinerae TaxID=281091 RepID=UPI00040B0389|nr:aspartate/glutamate racemase family protein [Azorhizobium doebereinerae]